MGDILRTNSFCFDGYWAADLYYNLSITFSGVRIFLNQTPELKHNYGYVTTFIHCDFPCRMTSAKKRMTFPRLSQYHLLSILATFLTFASNVPLKVRSKIQKFFPKFKILLNHAFLRLRICTKVQKASVGAPHGLPSV